MVAQTQFDPQNPDALFSPDQWLNQFSNYNNAALPWPSSYSGTPTNAMGQPIQPPPGTTLNSAPASPAPAAPAPSATSWNPTMGLQALANMSGKPVQSSAGGVMPTGQNTGLDHPQYIPSSYVYPQAAAPQAAPQAAAPTAPNNWQNTMAMLANPGKVTTPGATLFPPLQALNRGRRICSPSWPIGNRRRVGQAQAFRTILLLHLKEWDIEAPPPIERLHELFNYDPETGVADAPVIDVAQTRKRETE